MLHKMLPATIGLLYLGHVLVGLAANGQSTYEEILPKNVAAPPGVQAVIKCRLAYQNIAWTFAPKDGSSPFLVAFDCQPLELTKDRFAIDTKEDACHLIIKKVAANLAGTYTCQDVYSTDPVHSAKLTISPSVNLALNKNTIQSSSFHVPGQGLSSKAVDGVADGEWVHGSCSHTQNDGAAPVWWAVDLGQEASIGRVRITNRDDIPERLSNFYIGLTNVSPWTSAPNVAASSICKESAGYPLPKVPTDYTCDAGTEPGRYLFVMLKNQNPLTICELEAYNY